MTLDLRGFGPLCYSREEIADRDDPVRRGSFAGSVTTNSLRCATLVAMVQTANLRKGDNGTCRGRLYGPGLRTILAEREAKSKRWGRQIPGT